MMMIQSKMKPNGVRRNVAVLLVVICFCQVAFSYVHASGNRLDRNQQHVVDSSRITKDRQRFSTIFRRERVDVNPHVRDVRADSRQSRIDARDIRTDFREIRSELRGDVPNAQTYSRQYLIDSRQRLNDINNNRDRQIRDFQSTNADRNLDRLFRRERSDVSRRVSERRDSSLETRRIRNENRVILDRRLSENGFLDRVYRFTSSTERDRRTGIDEFGRRATVQGRVSESRRQVDGVSNGRYRGSERLVRAPEDRNDRNRSDGRRGNVRATTIRHANINNERERSETQTRFRKMSAGEMALFEGDRFMGEANSRRLLSKPVEDVAFTDKYPNITALNSIKVLLTLIILGQICMGASKSKKFRSFNWPAFYKIKTE
ncbi:uncharacterized protein LOC132699491 [Cylas formicarius]|uniref:uncharacterized protein LOC132699491 n=1 Tax=Cylas formicarius TaxID=197179 RepID=UPI0029588F3D|nr:uncharacterized protein LOC132699491 [Cylas formicarius]